MKKAKNKPKYKQSKILTYCLIASIVLIILCTFAYVIEKYRYLNASASQANINQTRELILLALRGVKKDAPVDPRTGDIYFPESKLYLPNPNNPLPMTYLYDTGNTINSQSELSVSTYPVRSTEMLYQANNIDELFSAVPKLQACSRGIKIVHKLFPESDNQNELKHTVVLNNGQTVYIYLEKECPELNDTADLFKYLIAY